MESEIWIPVLGYEGFYEVSNLGRIKNIRRNRILKDRLTKCGYCQVHLCYNGIKEYYIHRIVWEAFNGKIPDGMEINHIDENKLNNSLSNLSLVTHRTNCNHGTRNERMAKNKRKKDAV